MSCISISRCSRCGRRSRGRTRVSSRCARRRVTRRARRCRSPSAISSCRAGRRKVSKKGAAGAAIITALTPNSQIEAIYRAESRRVFATLVRLLGDFDLAEEALHEAFRAALEQWPGEGVPSNPRAWLVSTGRFKAIDAIRRRARFDPLEEEHAESLAAEEPAEREPIEADRLRLVFTCCHPALAQDAQVALTLREVCDLTTEESPARSSRRRRRWRSASCERRTRSAT